MRVPSAHANLTAVHSNRHNCSPCVQYIPHIRTSMADNMLHSPVSALGSLSTMRLAYLLAPSSSTSTRTQHTALHAGVPKLNRSDRMSQRTKHKRKHTHAQQPLVCSATEHMAMSVYIFVAECSPGSIVHTSTESTW